MTSSTYFPKEKTGLYHGNIQHHNKFFKQCRFGVSGTALDKYTNFLSAFTNLLWHVNPHYNNLKSRNCCTFREVTIKNLMNFNKPSEHRHKVKPINSTDAYIKVNNSLEHLDQSYFSKPHMSLLKEHAYTVCEAVSKHLEYLDNQVTRTTEAQNNTLIEA